jgi:hypothetical protein
MVSLRVSLSDCVDRDDRRFHHSLALRSLAAVSRVWVLGRRLSFVGSPTRSSLHSFTLSLGLQRAPLPKSVMNIRQRQCHHSEFGADQMDGNIHQTSLRVAAGLRVCVDLFGDLECRIQLPVQIGRR